MTLHSGGCLPRPLIFLIRSFDPFLAEPPRQLGFQFDGMHRGCHDPAHRAMFTAAKDALASRAAQAWVNGLIGRYGQVQDLKIDSQRKTLEVACLLEGEISPISIRIENYAVEAEGDKKFLRATSFSATRPWLQNFLADHGPRHRIELPAWAAAML